MIISEYYIHLKEPQIAPSTCSTWKKLQEIESNLSLEVRRRKWWHIANQRKTLIRIRRSRDNYELYSLEPYEQKVSAEQNCLQLALNHAERTARFWPLSQCRETPVGRRALSRSTTSGHVTWNGATSYPRLWWVPQRPAWWISTCNLMADKCCWNTGSCLINYTALHPAGQFSCSKLTCFHLIQTIFIFLSSMDQPDERNAHKHNLVAVLHWAATEPPYIKDHILRLMKRAAVL